MYRLNCALGDSIADRLCAYSEKSGVSKVNIVSMALDQYLTEQETKQKIMEQLADPNKLAEMMKVLKDSNLV